MSSGDGKGLSRLAELRAPIEAAITRAITDITPTLTRVNTIAEDAIARLSEYAVRGKLLRGALVIVGSSMGTPGDALTRASEIDRTTFDLAASIELIQSFLLIHDDVMDRDPVRRGGPAIHEQYRLAKPEAADAAHYGFSQAISVGDVALLLALNVVASSRLDPAIRLRILELLTREVAMVGIAQMGDVAFGHASEEPSEEQILSVYRYKTGRYTIALPLMLGAISAGVPEPTVTRLSELGESLGVVFQLKDDEIGLFTDQEKSGKRAGSDIIENKRTVLRRLTFEAATPEIRARLSSIFGNPDLSRDDLAFVRTVAKIAREESSRRIDSITERCLQQIAELSGIRDAQRQLLTEIAEYNRERRA